MAYGIPTKYGFINFRSRLEARWAAFFDILGWSWTYEPFDLPGWIPDFVIVGAHGSVLVEVKPCSTSTQMRAELNAVRASLSPGSPPAMVVGVSPFVLPEGGGVAEVVLGLGSRSGWGSNDDCEEWTEGFVLGRWKDEKTNELQFGIADQFSCYSDKLGVGYDGGRIRHAPFVEEVLPLWAAACNLTQWKAVTPC